MADSSPRQNARERAPVSHVHFGARYALDQCVPILEKCPAISLASLKRGSDYDPGAGKRGRIVASSKKKTAQSSKSPAAVQSARDLLARHHHFQGRVDQFEFALRGEALTVRGSVPTFYLKQLLQSLLKDIDGVGRIDNQVEVVRSDSPSGGAKHSARAPQ
jgi:hypothetical protein